MRPAARDVLPLASRGGGPTCSSMHEDPLSRNGSRQAETPRFEPEIIPPGRGRSGAEDGRSGAEDWAGGFGEETIRVHRATLRAPGPLSVIIALVVIGLIAATVLLVLIGVVLVWVPLGALVIAGLLLAATVRGYWRRLRRRWAGPGWVRPPDRA